MYGHSSDTDAVEVVSFRVHAYASSPGLKVKRIAGGSEDSSEACTAQGGCTLYRAEVPRNAWFTIGTVSKPE